MSDELPPDWNEDDLREWIAIDSSPADKQRFLEAHSALVDSQSAMLLEWEMEAWADDPEIVSMLRMHLEVITEAMERGGDPRQASKEAWVRRFGALALDLPGWLTQILDPSPDSPTEMTPEEQIRTVRAAMERVQAEEMANKQFILADLGLLLIDLLHLSESGESALYDEAIQISRAACGSYPAAIYPEQHAMAQFYLGTAIANHPDEPDFDAAIHALTTGLACMPPNETDDALALRAEIQMELARAYAKSETLPSEEKIARGLAAAEAALAVLTIDAFPEDWASLQEILGNLYHERIAGGRGENIERAITAYQNALQIFTEKEYPEQYAIIQVFLGEILSERIAGHPLTNPENAMFAHSNASRIFTKERYPEKYAATMFALGKTWLKRYAYPKRLTCSAAIQYFHEALSVFTREQYPRQYAMVQNALGTAYADMPEDSYNNIERAIAAYRAALGVLTLERHPDDYGNTMGNLGDAYAHRKADLRIQNLRKAVDCFDIALRAHDRKGYPIKHRRRLLDKALALAHLGDWAAAHQTYQMALDVESQLLRHEVGEEARATMLREGRDAALRDGYALAQLGRRDEAAVAVERGRAIGLSETFLLDAADAEQISDMDRRTRFIEARERFTRARAALYAVRRPIVDWRKALYMWFQTDDPSNREAETHQAAAFHDARDTLDAIVDEIRNAGDPGDFLQDRLDAATILRIAKTCGPGHALVYLAATPWGGFAVGAFAANPQTGAGAHFATLNLPGLTHDRLTDMTETKVAEGYMELLGGFASAQCASALQLMELPVWTRGVLGGSFRLRAGTIREVCLEIGKPSTLSAAAEKLLTAPRFREIVDLPFTAMDAAARSALDATMNYTFLDEEIHFCFPKLASMAMQPLAAWLKKEGATAVTLIPCGYLESYPLTAAPMADGQTFADTFATSVAPSARALRFEQPELFGRAGVFTFGDPTGPDGASTSLPWSEAESIAVDALARLRGLRHESYVQGRATRLRLNHVLERAAVVDASCHGAFDIQDFLHSGLLLAGGQMLTLADLLSSAGRLKGLRLLVLSACQTAIPDMRRQTNEVRSIAAAAIQAGARAVLAALWPVDDRATFILIVRFMQEWLPVMDREPPAFALAHAQQWLRTATNRKLRAWHTSSLPEIGSEELKEAGVRSGFISPFGYTSPWKRATLASDGEELQIRIRGGGTRYTVNEAEARIHKFADSSAADEIPYADPIYWAGFQIIGW